MHKISKNYFLSLIVISFSILIFFAGPNWVKADSYNPVSVNCDREGRHGGCNFQRSIPAGEEAYRIDWSLMADGFGDFGAAGGGVGMNVCFTPNGVMWNGSCVTAIRYHEGGPATCGGSGTEQDGRIGDNKGCRFTGVFEPILLATEYRYMNAEIYANDAHLWGTVAVYGRSPTCTNGATNYPTCTVGPDGECLNGNTNPPICDALPTCSNGANNPPTCTTFPPCSNGATNPPSCTTFPVNGICSPTHYSCSFGTSGSNSSNTSTWTWSCNGYNGGSNASCSETKPTCSNGATNPPTCTIPTTTGTVCVTNNTGSAYSIVGPDQTWSDTRTICFPNHVTGSYSASSASNSVSPTSGILNKDQTITFTINSGPPPPPPPPPPPDSGVSGTLTPSVWSCIIPIGQNSCNINFSWNTVFN